MHNLQGSAKAPHEEESEPTEHEILGPSKIKNRWLQSINGPLTFGVLSWFILICKYEKEEGIIP